MESGKKIFHISFCILFHFLLQVVSFFDGRNLFMHTSYIINLFVSLSVFVRSYAYQPEPLYFSLFTSQSYQNLLLIIIFISIIQPSYVFILGYVITYYACQCFHNVTGINKKISINISGSHSK